MTTGKVVIGVLAGVAAGAVLGMLFAPAKGSDTRKKILKTGSDSVEELNNKFDELMCSLNQKIESMKEEATEVYEKGKHKAEDLKNDLKAQLSKDFI